MHISEKIFKTLYPIFGNRIYADIAPQQEIQNDLQPFVIYKIISQTPVNKNGCGDFLIENRIQIDLYVASNNFNLIKNRIDFYNQAFNLLKNSGFSFKSHQTGFEQNTRLYRSMSEWVF